MQHGQYDRGRRVVVTGGSGLVGRELLRLLAADGDDPLALDLRPPEVPGARYVRADILTDDLAASLEGADAVMHLAARVDPPHPRRREAMRRLHEEGTENVVRAATRAGVRRLVLCSSAVVYGARADNPVPITEEHPSRPLETFPYAVDKARQEAIVSAAGQRLEVAIARPAIIYGAGARSYLTELLRRAPGVLPALDGRRPPLQFVHVHDVARALAALSRSSLTGPFNVGSRDLASFESVAKRAGLRVADVPRRLVAPVLDAAQWVVPGRLRAPSYVLDHLMYPFVVSSERLVRELGVTPRYGSLAAVDELFSARRAARAGSRR